MNLTPEQQETLDELVAEIFDSKRAGVNNSGPAYQIEFLMGEGVPITEIVSALTNS